MADISDDDTDSDTFNGGESPKEKQPEKYDMNMRRYAESKDIPVKSITELRQKTD